LLVGLLAISVGSELRAQERVSESDTQERNIDTYIGLLREDIQKQKVAIVSQLMQLSPEQAAAFWPVYNEYSKGLSALGDLRVRGIKEYAANFNSLSDEKATELANMRFDYEEKLLALKKKYFGDLSKAVGPKLAARFFQVENQLLDVVDLQVASSLPVIQ
jgi:type II secretory pathway component PulJ